MPSPVTCPSCGERLDIPADLRGTPVRCAACANVFVPPPAGGDDAPEVRPARPAARPAEPVEDEYLDDRDRPRRRKKGGSGWVWVLLAGLGLTTCLCCGGCGALFLWSENPTFEPYADPAGRFAAEFPGQPRPDQLAVGPGETMAGVECVREMTKESYFVYAADVPAGKGRGEKGADELLQAYADKVGRAKRGKEESRNLVTHQGHPAVDVYTMVSAFEGGTVFRVVVAGKRVYVVGVSGPVHPEAPRVEHFLDSLKVQDPADAKKDEGKKK
jgi:hypothetical protein